MLCARFESGQYAANPWIFCVLTHTILAKVTCTLIEWWPLWGLHCWRQKLPFQKEGQEQCAKKEPGKGNEALFALSHSSNGYDLYMYYLHVTHYYWSMSARFLINETSVSFSWFSLGGLALFHALHASLSVIWRLELRALLRLSVNSCFGCIVGCNLRIAQLIWGLLHEAWIQGLHRGIYRLSWFVLCAQHTCIHVHVHVLPPGKKMYLCLPYFPNVQHLKVFSMISL